MTKKVTIKENENAVDYSYYSNVLNKPFNSLDELREAEAAYYLEQKTKADKAAQKKADAQKVEDAFKALNRARKTYKKDLAQLTADYTEALTGLKQAFELGKKDIHNKLAAAEDAYNTELKEFTSKYDTFHLSLKDGDFETTISSSNNKVQVNPKATEKTDAKKAETDLFNLFDLLFGF